VGQLLTAGLALGLTLMAMLQLFGPELLHLLGATVENEDQARPLCVVFPAGGLF